MNLFQKNAADEATVSPAAIKTNPKKSASKQLFWQKFIYPLAIIIATSAVCLVMYFLYNNVYKTLSQAEFVTDLKGKIIEEQLQKSLFNEIIENINKKQKGLAIDFSKIANPLDFDSSQVEIITEAVPTPTVVSTTNSSTTISKASSTAN